MVDTPQTPISLNTDVQPQTISLGTDAQQDYLLSPELIQNRAEKLAYAFSGTPAAKPEEDIQNSLTQNKEADVRQEAASSINADQANARYNLISQTLSAKNGPLTPEDMTNIDTASGYNFPYKYPLDPNSVFEVKYGNQFASELDNFASKQSDSNFWNYGQLVARNDIEAAKIFGDVTTAQHQYLVTKMQDAQAKLEGQSTVGYAADAAKMFFPILNPYYELKMRGNVPGTGFFSGLLGSNLEDQRQKLNAMPFDQFTNTVDKVYSKLSNDNPQAAAAWLSAMAGQSTSDKILNNVNTIGNLSDVPLVFKIGQTVFSKATLQSQIQTALKTATIAANTPEATVADLKASVGDLQSSSLINASNLLTGRVSGSMSPVEDAFKTLPVNFNIFKRDIEASDLSIPHQNILLEQTNGAIQNQLTTLVNTLRPTELNLEGMSADILDRVSKTVTDRYPGENNSIIKVSVPTLNPITKMYEVTTWWGKDAGLFFDNVHEAADSVINKGFRVTYTPDQLAELDARISTIRDELGVNPKVSDLEGEANKYAKVVTNLQKTYEDTVAKFGKDSPQASEAQAELEGSKGDLRQANKSAFAARKAGLEDTENLQQAGPESITYHDTLADTLKTLEDKRVAVTRPGGVAIKQQGLGFYAEKVDNLRLQDKVIRDLVASPENPLAESPDSWTKYIPYLNHLRTAEDTFSPEGRAARKAATYPQAVFMGMVKKEGQVISDFLRGVNRNDPVTGELNPFYKRGVPGVRAFMNRGRLKEFTRVLDYSQNEAHDPVTGKEGYYMTPSELNNFYLTTFDRPASFEETQAYEAIKRWDELQRVFTQTQVYRGQARRGNELHTLKFGLPDGTIGRSPEFVGATRNKIPGGSGTMLIMGKDLKDSVVKYLGRASDKLKSDWNELVRNGSYRVIQLDDPEQLPFKDLGVKGGDNLIHYVLTPNVESSALRWDSVPRTGGGRFVYDYGMYIKQPKMKFENISGQRLSNYMGDQTVAPIAHRPLGEDVTKKMNTVRRLLKAGDDDGAKAAFIHNGLEGALEPWKDFRNKFERWKDDAGTWHEPVFNKEEDFRVVPRGKAIVDLDKNLASKYGPEASNARLRNTWHDATRENSPARNFQVQFTGERDAQGLQSIDNVGTTANPIYKKTPAKKIDPLSMLRRGMQTTVNSLFMDDYKNYGVTSWLKEAIPHLKERESSVWGSPFGTFNTITRDSFLSGAPQEEINRLMANHFKIQQLVGVPSVMDTFVHSVAQNLSDAAYKTLGPTAASYVAPRWLMPKLRDPFAFIRGVTFDAYLGLFSVPQMLVQSMNYVNMFAISPKYATHGTLGAYLHFLTNFNNTPEILNHLDKIASKFGYKPGEFLEAMNTLHDTGFMKVGGEHIYTDNIIRNNIIRSGKDTFLEWGRKPFQWGEQSSRAGAWYTAFKEFRDANPNGKLSNADIARILDKADMYQGNMSIASKSMLNSGVLSLPTQFYMYTTRLAEIFWSNSRLGGTLAERNLARTRLVVANAAMFGLPLAAGVTGLPVSDYIRKELLDNGYMGYTPPYVVGKNFVETLINEGLPAVAMHMMSGNYYNVGPRYGLQGLTNIQNTMNQDASFWKVMGGASASLSMNTFNNGIYPLMYQLYKGNYQNVKMEDLVDIFKEVQVVNSGWATWVAMNTGKWANKNSDLISDTSKSNAAFMFASGLRSDDQSDLFNKESVIKDRNDLQKYALKQFALQMNRAMIADSNNDRDNAQAFMNKAIAWLPASDFPPEKLGSAIVRAMKGAESIIDRTNMEFYISKAPQAQKEQLRKAFEYISQHKGQ